MKKIKKIFGPSQEEIWGQFAKEIDAYFENGSILETKEIVSKYDPWVITIDTYTQSIGEIKTKYTRFSAPIINNNDFNFEIYRRNRFNNIEIKLGMQDINIGYPDFDRDFIIKGNDEDKIAELFSSDRIRQLINNQSNIRFKIIENKKWLGSSRPKDPDDLCLETNEVIKDIDILRELYMLMILVLNKLSLMFPVEENISELEIEEVGNI